MSSLNPVGQFLRAYNATAVGATPPQPYLPDPATDGEETSETIDPNVEMLAREWKHRVVGEAPTRAGEHPVRFIDGSHSAQPALCLRAPRGWPIPVLVSELGAVALKLTQTGRSFVRDFVTVERVLSFVADPFPWAEVEAFAGAIQNDPALAARLVPANMPRAGHNPFDYEVMRAQAYNRCQQEMLNAERLALAADPKVPTLVDGKIASRIGTKAAAERPLLIGIVKKLPPVLHDEGWRVLLDLKPGQRTPVFKLTGMSGTTEADMPTASWFLKLAGGPRLAPNWGFVRVDVPWVQFESQFNTDFGFVNRLSRWLVDARCRTDSYARMPVSLDPIVRAEEALKPLFTPTALLVNRLYRTAGLFRGNEL
ncbi:hypothetical protein [Fimbriiglobus ruber]|uniref:NurA domain-containing protein n=1 Tax=Fimbriiglobus ruber TaxID=1908690 RepID=A0A225D8K3_9BACT|nr:hypothetical protein [Fimbriiglobus ruber]OWK37303.1 hypothetical protein FRUB_06423 [Fimbriiglobus ruber]